MPSQVHIAHFSNSHGPMAPWRGKNNSHNQSMVRGWTWLDGCMNHYSGLPRHTQSKIAYKILTEFFLEIPVKYCVVGVCKQYALFFKKK